MKKLLAVGLLSAAMLLASCGGGNEEKSSTPASSPEANVSSVEEAASSEAANSEDNAESKEEGKSEEKVESKESEDSEEIAETDYYICGSFNGWADAVGNATWSLNEGTDGNKGQKLNVHFAYGDQFKIVDGSNPDSLIWYGNEDGQNLQIEEAGTYNVYLNGSNIVFASLVESDGQEAPESKYYVVGSFGECNWGLSGAVEMSLVVGSDFKALSSPIEFEVGDELKVVDTYSTDSIKKYFDGDWDFVEDEEPSWWTVINGGNVQIVEAGTYVVGLTFNETVRIIVSN